MSIRRVNQDTPIDAGQWICMDSVFHDALIGPIREVTRVSGSRIYFLSFAAHDIGEYCSKRTVLFVCDTQDEAKMVQALSTARLKNLQTARQNIVEQYDKRLAELIEKQKGNHE